MKKLLLTMAGCAMAFGAFAAEETVLWEGTHDINWEWDDRLEITNEALEDLISGDQIIFTVSNAFKTAEEEWPQIVVRPIDDGKATIFSIGCWDDVDADFPILKSYAIPYLEPTGLDNLTKGFAVQGGNVVITKIVIAKTGDPSIQVPEGDVLYFNPSGWEVAWGNALNFGKDITADFEAGQYLNFYVSEVNQTPQAWPQLKLHYNWIENEEITYLQLFEAGDDFYEAFKAPCVVSYQMTADDVENLVANGLMVTGTGATLTAVTLSDEAEEDPDGPSAVNTIAVEKEELSVYNLQGVKMNVKSVNELGKGIYVVNGKKVMVK